MAATDYMYFTYGKHTHPRGEVNLTSFEFIPQFSERRKRWAVLYRLHLSGEILVDEGLTTPTQVQANLDTKIKALIAAYQYNGFSGGLWHGNGTPTSHYLDNAYVGALSDVQVAYRSWPKGNPAQYASHRTFYIVLQQMVAAVESQILHFRETVRFVGDAGLAWEWVKLPIGLAVQQNFVQSDTQKIIQQGTVIGFQGWPVVHARPPLLPALEHRERRIIDYMEPRFSGRQYTHYGISWKYTMEANVPQAVVPGTPAFP